jgi:hypothetical protein
MWGMAIRFIWNNPARGMAILWWLFMADLVRGAALQCADISIRPNIASSCLINAMWSFTALCQHRTQYNVGFGA